MKLLFLMVHSFSKFLVGTKWTYFSYRSTSVKASVLDLKMGHTLLSVLLFHLLNTLLYYGHAQVLDAVLTIDPNWSTFYIGESVTFICDMNEGDDADWEYFIYKDGHDYLPYDTHKRTHTVSYLFSDDNGDYQCGGRRWGSSYEKSSNTVSLTVSAQTKATLTADTTTIPIGGSVTLTCSVQNSDGWKYEWIRRTHGTSAVQVDPVRTNDEQNKVISVSQEGIYQCRGRRGKSVYYTDRSDEVIIGKTFSNEVVLRRQLAWAQMFSGERITLTCEVHGDETIQWMYEWRRPGLNAYRTYDNYQTFIVSESSSGDYMCRSILRDGFWSSTEWSKAVTLSVSGKPKALINADVRDIPVGGSVTLICSVKPSSGWKYYWYRDEKLSQPLTSKDAVFPSNGQISVSEGGLYRCIGGRGNPVYYTEYSDPVTIKNNVPNRAVLTVQPDWPQIYRGEKRTLKCEIHGGDIEWEYEWKSTSSIKPPNQNEFIINAGSSLHNGEYRCKGIMKSAQKSSTDWSDPFSLLVLDKPKAVLTVSPSWLSPGASVTLSCEVEHPSAGWRFYWYQTVPDLSGPSYSYELLPGSINGTEQDSYIIDGQTQTAGYACRAGRGDREYYTDYSKPTFVWSGDLHSAASLTVNPDTVQHFVSQSISLSCEGNSTKWRVSRFTDDDFLSHCSDWGTMNGSTCHVNKMWYGNTVYWCESGSTFSNAVNITGQYDDGVILVSPVHPVTEGDSVTLGCKSWTQIVLSNVLFYKNDKLVQKDSRGEMSISAVSKSDEGFYKCQHSGRESAQSWMAVKKSSLDKSSFPVLLITRLVCGLFLIILLLLLFCCYKQSKDSCFIRSQSSNQRSAADNTMNQDEALNNECVVPVNDESTDVTYSSIELKNVTKKGKKKNPEESAVYSAVKRRSSTDDSLMYAQVLSHKKGKAKRDKGESAAEETVYSKVKPGRAADQ